MPAGKSHPGNKFGEKYKTPEKRLEVFNQYLEHLEAGYSKESFRPCDYRTMEKYIDEYPTELQSELVQGAMRGNRFFWEDMGLRGTKGELQGFNSSSWKFNMNNRFGWSEKREQDHTSGGKPIQINPVNYSTYDSEHSDTDSV